MKKIILLSVLIAAVLGGSLFFWNDISDFFSKLLLRLPNVEKGITDLIQEAEKQISTPSPLRIEREAPEAFLTLSGIIQRTNIQRAKYGLAPLRENEALDTSAAIKTEDMFVRQYFAHDSPSGANVGDLAEKVGYQFIAIGENLALGNFDNDEVLVQAWMDSPGHRENILNDKYQEIGVAVAKGVFEGKTVWLAVQHFGRPLSACLQPSKTLAYEIEMNQNQIKELDKTLTELRTEIETTRPKRGPAYEQKIKQYNNLVDQYNVLTNETEVLINQYNNQIKLFNECVVG